MQRSIRLLLVTAAMVYAAVSVRGEITAKDALSNIPDSIITPLSQSTMHELIAYFEASQTDKTLANELRGSAKIEALDQYQAKVKTGKSRMLTLNILATKSDTVYSIIETLETPAKDSKLTIYNARWQPQDKLWDEPKSKDWLNEYGRKYRRAFEQEVPYILAEYTFDESTGILTLTNRSKENKFTYAELRYRWTPKGFKMIKK